MCCAIAAGQQLQQWFFYLPCGPNEMTLQAKLGPRIRVWLPWLQQRDEPRVSLHWPSTLCSDGHRGWWDSWRCWRDVLQFQKSRFEKKPPGWQKLPVEEKKSLICSRNISSLNTFKIKGLSGCSPASRSSSGVVLSMMELQQPTDRQTEQKSLTLFQPPQSSPESLGFTAEGGRLWLRRWSALVVQS